MRDRDRFKLIVGMLYGEEKSNEELAAISKLAYECRNAESMGTMNTAISSRSTRLGGGGWLRPDFRDISPMFRLSPQRIPLPPLSTGFGRLRYGMSRAGRGISRFTPSHEG